MTSNIEIKKEIEILMQQNKELYTVIKTTTNRTARNDAEDKVRSNLNRIHKLRNAIEEK